MEQQAFESKIKPVLLWMGTIVAAVMAIAYVIVVFVLIEGFAAKTLLNTSLFSLVTAIIGFCIMQMLKIQGQSFAKDIEENKIVLKKYTNRKTKDKKFHSLKYFWITSGSIDLITKCLTLAATSVGMVYIMIEGNKDYSLLLLAGVNLLMFAGFGLIALVKAYDFYNESYIPYMLSKIEEAENEEKEQEALKTENKRLMEMAQKRNNQQGHIGVCNNRGDNFLESSMDNSPVSIVDKPVVLDTDECNNNLLGRTIHTSNTTSDSFYNVTEETIQKHKDLEENK